MPESGNIHRRKPNCIRRNRRYLYCAAVLVLILLAVFLILAFTVFKPRDPQISLVSATVAGISPHVSFPAAKIELKLTLNLELRVHNPNHAGFTYGGGKSLVFYRGEQVGDVDLDPGRIPADGSENVRCRLTIQTEKLIENMKLLLQDVLAGAVEFDTWTTVPGRVSFLRIFRHHVVVLAECHVAISFPGLKVRHQDCKRKVKV